MGMSLETKERMKITICMGSSCFARGNGDNLDVIEDFLKAHEIEATVDLAGSRCEGCCAEGPNVEVDGQRFQQVDRGMMLDILQEFGFKEGRGNE
jgi:NADH:ubiquinone oxidoreductase subunit E